MTLSEEIIENDTLTENIFKLSTDLSTFNMNLIDLSVDGSRGILKQIIKKGDGEELPIYGDRIFINYSTELFDGTIIEKYDNKENYYKFDLGKGDVLKAWDIVVATMKKGETCRIYCNPNNAYGKLGRLPKVPPNSNVIFEIKLFDFKGQDISDEFNETILKSIRIEGLGFKKPQIMSNCIINMEGNYFGNIFDKREVNFIMGEGFEFNIVPGIEKALKEFKLNEKSILKLHSSEAYGNIGNEEFKIPPNAYLDYIVELKHFETIKESWEFNSLEEKAISTNNLKEKATRLFNLNQPIVAINYYEKIIEYWKDEIKLEYDQCLIRNSFLLIANLNRAACYLKMNRYKECIDACNYALKFDSENCKGLYRRAMAHLYLYDYLPAFDDLKKLVSIDPNNKIAKKKLLFASEKVKEHIKKEKKIYSNMF